MKRILLALVLLTGIAYADEASEIEAIQSFIEKNKILIEVTYDSSETCKLMIKILGNTGILDESCITMLKGATNLSEIAPRIENDNLTFADAETDYNSLTIRQFVQTSNNMDYITTRLGE